MLEPTQPDDRTVLSALRLSALVLVAGALTLVVPLLAGSVAPSGASEDVSSRAAIRVEAQEETLPPVLLGDRSFTIVVHKKRLHWPPAANVRFDPDDHETAESFEIRDAEGRVLYSHGVVDDPRELESSRVRNAGRFLFSYAVHPYVLEASSGQALMVDWYFFPSAPSACSTHWILGLVEDELVPFGEPFCAILEHPRTASASGWQLKRLDGEEVLEIRWRSPFFSLLFPVAVDFDAGRLLPSQHCTNRTDSADRDDHCEVAVRAYRQPGERETRVRLFPRPDPAATPRIVAVKPASDVEFLSAVAPHLFDAEGQWSPPADPDQSFWLRVSVDGHEGWVRDEVDLFALGLRAAG